MSDEDTRGLRRLHADLTRTSAGPADAHLSDDDFLEYSMDSTAPSDLPRVDAHLSSCARCADRMEHLLSLAEAWTGSGGEQRTAALAERIHVELARRGGAATAPPGLLADARRLWEALHQQVPDLRAFPMRFGSGMSRSLSLSPALAHFGSEERPASLDGAATFLIGSPEAFALSDLYCRSGRDLPNEAEVFWGHEVWLIHVPVSVAVEQPLAALAVGVSLRLPGEAVEVVDVLPRSDLAATALGGLSPLVVDVGWDGSFRTRDEGLVPQGELHVVGGGRVQNVQRADLVGRLTAHVLALPVDSAASGIGQAWFVWRPGNLLTTTVGGVWMTVVTDKHREDLEVETEPWVTIRGLTGVPTRLVSEPARFLVRLREP